MAEREHSEIIIPDLGLFSHYPKEQVPRQRQEDGSLRIGWSYCRNVSLSRKAGCIKKSKGMADFTTSATGATDSVRGIGILNKYARPNDYEKSTINRPAANADDGSDDGTTHTNNTEGLALGNPATDIILRFPGWTIAQSTQIISASLKLWSDTSGTIKTVLIKIYGDDQSDPGQIADHADYAGRTPTTASVTTEIGTPFTPYPYDWEHSIDVTDIIQELINSFAYVNESIQLFVTDNGSTTGNVMNIIAYDHGDANSYASLEIVTTAGLATSPTFFMFVKGATVGELWKLDNSQSPANVSQGGESYASTYQTQTGKFLQYGNDLLFTDDGYNDALQIWDVSANPSTFVDALANYNGRYLAEFKARAWLIYSILAGVIYNQRNYYSALDDATSFPSYASNFGSDSPTGVIALTQDDLIVFKEGSTIRIVDRQTTASDFQVYVVSSKDGSLGGNVVSDGARVYGINEKGVFQWPVAGHPNGFRYISPPIQDEIDKIDLTKMNLVWFAVDPVNKTILMNYPNTGGTRNDLCAVFNWEKDTWENISDIWAGNVMIDGFDNNGSPYVFLGQEDGHIKKITGDDDEGSNYTGRIDTGALFLRRSKNGPLVRRTLQGIEPISNYDGSITLNFYYKSYDRPGDESAASWNGPYTHATRIGNEEFVPIIPSDSKYYHIIRIDGTLKDEAFEIQALRLIWS